jgi:hypothetical protein
MVRKPNILFSLLIVLLVSIQTHGQLQLNEMMPSNTLTKADQFDEYPDWLEIYNAGENTISLDSIYLSDDPDNLLKWNFPHMDLLAGDFLLAFASGKDIREGMIHWHTHINMGDEWNYHIPVAEIGKQWKTLTQNDTSWYTGKSGIGFGDNDDSTLIENCLTLYMQKEFSVKDTSAIKVLSLYMDYDDGFVAYLNGVECARSTTMGVPGSETSFDAPALSGHEANMYKAGSIENFTIDLDLLINGVNILAIEVHNVQATSSDMSAIPILMTGANAIMEGLKLGNQYITLADHYPHANFRIKANGEPVYLSNNRGEILDSLPIISVPNDYSFGLTRGMKDEYGFFAEPSPGYTNTSDYASSITLDSVIVLNDDSVYDSLQVIKFQTANSIDSVYYTLDGSEPGLDDLLYTDSIKIRETSVIRCRILKHGSLPGPISTRTIFTGRKHDLNIFSIAMEPNDLWDFETGIYVMGPNANPNVPYNGANFWQDWERPAHFEILNPEGDLLFEQSAGTKIFGGRSRTKPHKSQTFYARSRYGEGEFLYPLFSKKQHTSYEAFIIRNSGNDWGKAMLRDAITAHISEEMKLDHQAYEPVAQYINGEYWGLINMREKIHEHFISAQYHVDPDEVNLIQGNMNIQAGSLNRYNELLEYLRTKDLTDDSVFSELRSYIDLDYYKRYWALNVYINNKDWPSNNSKFWSTNTPGAQWRWIEYDTDFAYSPWGEKDYNINTLLFALSEGNLHTYANKPWATEVIRMLIQNEQYQKEICNTFADGLNYYFHPDRMLPVIDSFQNRIKSEAPYHFSRWELSLDDWYIQVDKIREYFQNRPFQMKKHLMERFNISGEHNVVVDLNDPEGGKVRINTITPGTYPFEGSYFHDISITMEAIPAPGYMFSYWEGDVVEDSTVISFDMLADGYFKAVFVQVTDEEPDMVINEINYCSSPERDTKDWIEIYNNSNTPVDLSGWYLEDGFSGKQFYFQSETTMQIGSYLVINHSRPDFKRYFPENGPIAGDMEIKLDSISDGIGIYTPEGVLHDYVIYESLRPWPEEANGTGATLELIHPDLDNSLPESWKSASNMKGTPGLKNSVYEEVKTDIESPVMTLPKLQVYPSPFTEKTYISFDLKREMPLSLSIHDISGRMVAQLQNGPLSEGRHILNWNPGADVSPGIYIVRIRSAQFNRSLRVVYMQ